jgi:sn-glycerol 3-phosphate transport system substrate-binding protein
MKTMTTLIAAMTAGLIAGLTANTVNAAIEISWWHAMDGRMGEIVNEFTEKFNAEEKSDLGPCHLTANYKGTYSETMVSAIAAFRSKEQPHIVQIFDVGTPTMIAAEGKGAIYPVHQLMDDTGIAFDQSDYLPSVISYYSTQDGKLLSLPFNSSTPVLWYNNTTFEELGISVPTTWDELETAAGKAKDGGVESPFSFGWQSWSMIENYSAWHNIPTGTEENGLAGTDTELAINNDAMVEHIQLIADMGNDGLFVYGGRQDDSRAMFVNGETVLWIGSSANYGEFTKVITGFEFAQTMMPLDTAVADAPQNSIIGGATLWVLKGGEQDEYQCVAKFFQFLSAVDQQAYLHQETGYVPITMAAYEKSKADGFYNSNPGTDTAIQELLLNQPTPNSKGQRYGNFVQIRDVINEELEAVWADEKTVHEALDSAVERGNELLRQFEATNQ